MDEPQKPSVKDRLFPLKPWYRNLWFASMKDAFFFFSILFLLLGFHQMTEYYRAVAESPCEYCATCRMPYYQPVAGKNYEWLNASIPSGEGPG